ncbi:hypothetical protein V1264_017024 [Littorina saxatilis]|uniref:non-specific serine/threonine protein kinase n=1 Tax=Littorina saxatilis TaxID=31220 RepID=A0AAN9BH73_9CAEN
MAGLLSTTLTGSMEAIHMAPVNEAHLKTSSSQPPALELNSSNLKTSSDTASAQESLQQTTAAGSENDSSVLNSSRDVNARNVQQSSNSSNYQSKDNPKSQGGSVTDKSRTENKDKTASPATAGNVNDRASLSKTKSMKRKRCDEDSESEKKSAAKKGGAERVSVEKTEEDEQTRSPAASKGRATFFVKDWEFVQVLGEGAYGEVKLAYNVKTREAVAVKIVDTSEKGVVWDDVRKEVCIHRMISHQNIIKFYGVRREGDIQYLFLEYASGGELFDRIEPDVGMPQAEAQKYFRQLIDGVEYLHSKGIAHRDIKPENLLLDENDDLKIADFGLATIFRYQEKWRYLERLCGSAPYLAPEVINNKPYRAEPADLWSCGIVFVAMLGGELPWDAAVLACVEYVNWRECHIEYRPWNKIDNLALCLLRRLLVDKPEKRYTITDIRKNQWFNKNFSKGECSLLFKVFDFTSAE